jgi:hypothetical protein
LHAVPYGVIRMEETPLYNVEEYEHDQRERKSHRGRPTTWLGPIQGTVYDRPRMWRHYRRPLPDGSYLTRPRLCGV